MSILPKVFLNKGKEKSLLNYHPWLFSGAVKGIERKIEEGEVVEVWSSENKYVATGHFHDGGICVKIFSFKQVEPDYQFWKAKINDAWSAREALGMLSSTETTAFRLVHGEGDSLPGLIIDWYDGVAVMQAHTTGMHRIREHFVQALKEIVGDRLKAVYDKSSETLSKGKVKLSENQYLYEAAGFERKTGWIKENGLKFIVNWEEGQKTAFFLDQRENRSLLQRYANGRKVLNTFSYSGGFSVYALAGGAISVDSVDSSAKASAWCDQNINANSSSEKHRTITADAFDFLKANKEEYDLIVLDPPAFAKHLSSVKKACYGYQSLNTTAFKQIKDGGILFTFSCSQVIDRKLFRQVIFAAAAEAGKKVSILHQLSQPADHPISIYHPEGEYLKGLVLRVDPI